MKIETVRTIKEIEVEKISKEEIENLVRKVLEAHRYISVLTESKYTEDKWK